MPKLTSLTTEGRESKAFHNPRSITLEGMSYHSILTNRYALSHYCHSYQGMGFLREENPPHQEFLFLLSLIPRHHSRSPKVSPVHCFFQTLFIFHSQLLIIHTPTQHHPPISTSLNPTQHTSMQTAPLFRASNHLHFPIQSLPCCAILFSSCCSSLFQSAPAHQHVQFA